MCEMWELDYSIQNGWNNELRKIENKRLKKKIFENEARNSNDSFILVLQMQPKIFKLVLAKILFCSHDMTTIKLKYF